MTTPTIFSPRPNILTVRNEDEAWEFLQVAIENRLPEDIGSITFENWPNIDIKLEGSAFHSSMTTKSMEGFIELQNCIYRSYALAIYNKPSSRSLTNEEKDKLAFTVNVSEGSSGLMAALEESLKAFAIKIADKMDPQHIIITVLGAGLLWGGTVCFKSYLEHLRKSKEIDMQAILGEQENRRMETMANAINKAPVLLAIKENTDHTYNELLKSFSDADTVSVAGHTLDKETVNDLLKSSRSQAQEIQCNGIYKITKVDSSNFESFKVVVFNIDTGQSFPAEVQDAFVVRGRNRDRLQKAEWERLPVYLEINAKLAKGQILGATIIGVKDAPA